VILLSISSLGVGREVKKGEAHFGRVGMGSKTY
jgi:hypothetical protein